MGSTITASEWLTLAINTVLPIVVAFVTSRLADSGAKALALLALSALTTYLVGILAALNAGQGIDWSHLTFTAIVGFGIAVAAHFGLWKPVGITGTEGAVSRVGVKGRGNRAAG